jgi:hypothetical protein
MFWSASKTKKLATVIFIAILEMTRFGRITKQLFEAHQGIFRFKISTRLKELAKSEANLQFSHYLLS